MPTKCLDTELVNGSMSMTGIEVMLMAAAYLNLCQSVNVLALQKINMDSYSGRKSTKTKTINFYYFYDLTTLKILKWIKFYSTRSSPYLSMSHTLSP